MLHRVSSPDVQELNRVLELIQKQGNSAPASSNAQNSSSPSGGSGSIVFGSTATGTTGPTGPAGPAGVDGSTASLLVGADLIPEALLAANGDILTDESGYALIGVHVSSSILTGTGVSSIEVLSGA